MKYRKFVGILPSLALALSASAGTITVTTPDNASTPGDGQISLLEALQQSADGDTIRFNIPGAGPHRIQTPLGGYPLITAHNLTIDGYTQPGATPNTNPILGGNNAQIKIVLDSTASDSDTTDPQDPTLNSRRSTRILHSGYGDSENGMLAVFAADNFTVRGLSFIGRHTDGSTGDPSIYAVALVNQATNAHIQGCWFGLPPGGRGMADLKPISAAVAGFRYRTGGDVYSFGCVVGTDGDGVNDRSEFNVIVGCHIPLALELPGARVSGNYVNVFPDGNTFADPTAIHDLLLATGRTKGDASVENFENGRVTDDTIIGTDGDGVSDSDERNIFGHTFYDHDLEFYGDGGNVTIAGNYFGVGVDGIARAPHGVGVEQDFSQPDFADVGGGMRSVRVGSNGDGVSDNLEANVIVGVPGKRFVVAGSGSQIVCRGNKLTDNACKAIPFADGDNAPYTAYYAPYLLNTADGTTPVITSYKGGILSGTLPAANTAAYPSAIIDLYQVDGAALNNTNYWPLPVVHGARLLESYTDNGVEDLDAAANKFSFNLASLNLPASAHVAVAVTFSSGSSGFSATNSVTSPLSNPVASRPTLKLVQSPADAGAISQLSWLAPDGRFLLQLNPTSISQEPEWFEILDHTYTGGRNVITLPGVADVVFFRLITNPNP